MTRRPSSRSARKADPRLLWQQAVTLYDAGDFATAGDILERLRPLQPAHPPLLHLLGVCRFRGGQHAAGIALLEQAAALAPQLVPALCDLGNLLTETGQTDRAIAMFRRALAVEPGHSAAACNLAHLLAAGGDRTAALAELDQVLSRQPEAVMPRWTRSLIALSYKDFPDGWRDYAVRWRLPPAEFSSSHDDFGLPPAPMDGPPPDGEVWLWREQGIGDEILYASVIGAAIARGWRLRFGCSRRLLSLFRRSFPGLPVVAIESAGAATEAAQCRSQLPLADLAAALRREAGDFGTGAAYLLPDPALRDSLRESYSRMAPGKRLAGLSWRSSNRISAAAKSPPLKAFSALLASPQAAFVNLQYGPAEPDLTTLRQLAVAPVLDDPGIDPLGDIDRFAAQIAALDAVVTVSNTTAHLAGALGVPTLVLLPAHDGLMWYWFREDTRSPWYASVSLSRQAAIGDWSAAMAGAVDWLDRQFSPPG